MYVTWRARACAVFSRAPKIIWFFIFFGKIENARIYEFGIWALLAQTTRNRMVIWFIMKIAVFHVEKSIENWALHFQRPLIIFTFLEKISTRKPKNNTICIIFLRAIVLHNWFLKIMCMGSNFIDPHPAD